MSASRRAPSWRSPAFAGLVALLAGLVAGVAPAGDESPGSYLDFYHSPPDDGSGSFDSFDTAGPGGEGLGTYFEDASWGSGSFTIHLWMDPTTVNQQTGAGSGSGQGPGIYSAAQVLLQVSGGWTVTDFTGCSSPCTEGVPSDPSTDLFFTYGNGSDPIGAPVKIGDVQISASGPGALDLVYAEVFDTDFDFPVYEADAVARTLPAPPAPATPDMKIQAVEGGDFLGAGTAHGDVNGDGFQDLILGVPGGDGGDTPLSAAGEVHVIFGSPTLGGVRNLDNTPSDWIVYGGTADAWLGAAVTSGDVNGDGIDDLIMGSYLRSTVHVVFGQPGAGGEIDLSFATADYVVTGAAPDDGVGRSLLAADLNGDGIDELVIGAPLADGAGDARPESGEVHVILGPLSSGGSRDLGSQPGDLVIFGADPDDQLALSEFFAGQPLAAADLDGDSIDDLIVGAAGADGEDNTRADSGEVHVILGESLLGGTRDLAVTPGDLVLLGASSGDRLGRGVAAGDVNDDGAPDLLAGAPSADVAGEAHVLFGPFLPSETRDLALTPGDLWVTADDPNDLLGMNVAVGDLDGDGILDVVLGAPGGSGENNSKSAAGEVYVVYGSASLGGLLPLDTAFADLVLYGDETSALLASSLTVADVTGDGADDLIAGAYQRDFPPSQIDAGEVQVLFGVPSDTDGDGVDDPSDNCRNTPNPLQADRDNDGVGDLCDNCPDKSNHAQKDTDQDGTGDACEILELIVTPIPGGGQGPQGAGAGVPAGTNEISRFELRIGCSEPIEEVNYGMRPPPGHAVSDMDFGPGCTLSDCTAATGLGPTVDPASSFAGVIPGTDPNVLSFTVVGAPLCESFEDVLLATVELTVPAGEETASPQLSSDTNAERGVPPASGEGGAPVQDEQVLEFQGPLAPDVRVELNRSAPELDASGRSFELDVESSLELARATLAFQIPGLAPGQLILASCVTPDGPDERRSCDSADAELPGDVSPGVDLSQTFTLGPAPSLSPPDALFVNLEGGGEFGALNVPGKRAVLGRLRITTGGSNPPIPNLIANGLVFEEVGGAVIAASRIALVKGFDRGSDLDADGREDDTDNCPFAQNTDQRDAGGFNQSAADAIGDRCQCGEATGDGTVLAEDAMRLRELLAGQPVPNLGETSARCSILRGTECNIADVVALRRALAGLSPSPLPVCTRAVP